MDSSSGLYIEIDLLVAVYILIMVVNLWRTRKVSNTDKAYFTGVMSIGIILITDIIATAFEGVPGAFVHVLLYLDNVVYFTCTGVASYACLLYVDYALSDNASAVDERKIMYNVPPAAITFLSLASLRYPLLFYIDEANYYHRGNLHVIQQILTTLYFVIALVYTIVNLIKATNYNKASMCKKMFIFTLVPLVGLILQIIFPNGAFIWPFASIGMFIIFTVLQNSQISMDTLTGLNNRSRLVRYINERCEKWDPNHVLTCMVMDIDNFKNINDRYGHEVGDEAIKELADVVKKSVVHVEGSHFIARYTGNSFAIVSYADRDHTGEIGRNFNNELEILNDSDRNRYQISVSMGAMVFDKTSMSPDDFLKAADNAMYQQKAARKAAKQKLNVEDVMS